MTLEQRLEGALRQTDDYAPSVDLFAKVQRSIEEDAAHRRRTRRALAWSGAGVVAAIGWVAAFLDVSDGTATMPWWTVEVLTAAILIALVVVLGPLLRRFGTALTLEIFRPNPATSGRFLAVLDIAYYLVFTAFILMSTNFAAQVEWGGRLADQVELELFRIGGLLLFMGVLHAVTIAVLPVMGLIFAANWRRAARAQLGSAAPPPAPGAEKADRVATIIVWVTAALLAVPTLLFIIPAIAGLFLGAE
jgi:hypothetical protein